ncbi:hypothetical protein [Paractinoplanes atraurantiacus]|uniref:hypothetical protein n=1 Tax=Paractinoplanes atraurantiacus TaxID=1036182 RepID=UPI001178C672|nr:hypothetical protein [Actinoplanes atraurantiacus]
MTSWNRLLKRLDSPKAATRAAALRAAGERCDSDRSAAVWLAPLIGDALDDGDRGVREAALEALTNLGEASRQFTPVFRRVAGGAELGAVLRRVGEGAEAGPVVRRVGEGAAVEPEDGDPGARVGSAGEDGAAGVAPAGFGGPSMADRAMGALQRLGDPAWVHVLCDAAAAGREPPGIGVEARLTPEVLAAVRGRLGAEPERVGRLAWRLERWAGEEWALERRWGADVASAVPELIAARRHDPEAVAAALLAIGHDDPAGLPSLIERVARRYDLCAAVAIWRMTGDAQPAHELLRAFLRRAREVPRSGLDVIDRLGIALVPLEATAREHLTGRAAASVPERNAQVLAARIVAVLGDPAAIVDTLRAVLRAGEAPGKHAALVAGDFRLDLRDELRALLTDLWCAAEAAGALARMGEPVEEALVPDRLAVVLELRRADAIPLLERLAGEHDATRDIWDDELRRSRIRAVVGELRAYGEMGLLEKGAQG